MREVPPSAARARPPAGPEDRRVAEMVAAEGSKHRNESRIVSSRSPFAVDTGHPHGHSNQEAQDEDDTSSGNSSSDNKAVASSNRFSALS